MNAETLDRFSNTLDDLLEAYDCYRVLQEREHSHLSRRGPIAEWNLLVRRRNVAAEAARNLEASMADLFQSWHALDAERTRNEFAGIREKLSRLQSLLMRILTCERMNESLLYSQGYMQSVVAYRSQTAGAGAPPAG